MKIFEHLGYHLDLYCKHTYKYQGSVKIDNPDPDRKHSYSGRKVEYINSIGHKSTKQKQFTGEFLTEVIPLCGRVLGDAKQVIAASRMRMAAYMPKRNM